MSIAVGIDLGTTNTVVGAVRDGRAITLADDGGRRLIPSIVSFHPSGKVLVGDTAKDRRIVDPGNTIYSIKRLIGRTWGSDEVERSRRSFGFELVEGPKQGVAIVARGETYTLPEISAFVLRRAKQIAEAALGETVDRAVITVPANFNDPQRAATKLAGKLAGLEVLRILNEPTAAALAYGQSSGQNERIAVYDLGGGTFDVTLLDLSGNVFEVLATGGDTALGGDDIDQLIAERMAMHILENHRVDPRTDPSARATLRARGEVLKQELSAREEATCELNDVVRGHGGDLIPVSFSMTRAQLEKLSGSLIDRTLETCRFSIETIGIKLGELDRVILVGGATRMPLVVRRVEQYFQRQATGRVNPDEVVALGAAIQAAALNRAARGKAKAPEPPARPASLSPAAPPSHRVSAPPQPAAPRAAPPGPLLAAQAKGAPSVPPPPAWVGAAAAPGPTAPMPGSSSPKHDTIVQSEAPEIERAEMGAGSFDFKLELPAPPAGRAVAPGAPHPPGPPPAPQKKPAPPPAVPSARAPELLVPVAPLPAPLLIDVTPISLGVEVAGGFTDVLIAANTPVPCDRTRVFRTASDGQTAVIVRVGQGESRKFAENTTLGDLELSGLKRAARGDAKIAVTFEIDADGILNVRAKDVDSGRETGAKMHLLGTQTDAAAVADMVARQQRHTVG